MTSNTKRRFEVHGPEDKPVIVEADFCDVKEGGALIFRNDFRVVRAFAPENWQEVRDLGPAKGEA